MTRMVPSMHSSCSRSKRLCIKDLFGWEIADRRVLCFFAEKTGEIPKEHRKKGVPFLKCFSIFACWEKTPSTHSEIQPGVSENKKNTTDHGKVPRITP